MSTPNPSPSGKRSGAKRRESRRSAAGTPDPGGSPQPLSSRSTSRRSATSAPDGGQPITRSSSTPVARPPVARPRASSLTGREQSHPRSIQGAEFQLLRSELRLSDHQCQLAEQFAKTSYLEAKQFPQTRKKLCDEVTELRQALATAEAERDQHAAQAESSAAAVEEMRKQLDREVRARQQALEKTRALMIQVQAGEMEAASKMHARVTTWEKEVLTHVNHGYTMRVDPMIFQSNAPMFERVIKLFADERGFFERRKQELEALQAEQIDVTRAANAADVESLSGQLGRARQLDAAVREATAKAHTKFYVDEIASVRRRSESLEKQLRLLNTARDEARGESVRALQELRAELRANEKVVRDALETAGADSAALANGASANAAQLAQVGAQAQKELRAVGLRAEQLEKEVAALKRELAAAAAKESAGAPRGGSVSLNGTMVSAEWAVLEHSRMAAEARVLAATLDDADADAVAAVGRHRAAGDARAKEAAELKSALDGEKRRRARLSKRSAALQSEAQELRQKDEDEKADQHAKLQAQQMRATRSDADLAEERAQREAMQLKMMRLRGSLVEQAFSKQSLSLLARCWRAWRECAAQHAAFKALAGRGEVVSPIMRRSGVQPAPSGVTSALTFAA